jgi:hypothetical protein
MTTTEHVSTLPPPPPPPSGGRTWKPIVAGLAILAGCGLVSGTIAGLDEVADRVDAEEADSQDDATIRGCGTLGATVTVTNDSSGSSTYLIDVDFVRDGQTVDQDDVIVSELAAGATAEVDAASDVAGAPGVECRVAHVERFSD